MKDDRGVLLIATARGMVPIDRQRFAAGFLAKHEASRWLRDGLVHAFSQTRHNLKRNVTTPEGIECVITERDDGWATFCVSQLSHKNLPGMPCPIENVTCVACVAAMLG